MKTSNQSPLLYHLGNKTFKLDEGRSLYESTTDIELETGNHYALKNNALKNKVRCFGKSIQAKVRHWLLVNSEVLCDKIKLDHTVKGNYLLYGIIWHFSYMYFLIYLHSLSCLIGLHQLFFRHKERKHYQ